MNNLNYNITPDIFKLIGKDRNKFPIKFNKEKFNEIHNSIENFIVPPSI